MEKSEILSKSDFNESEMALIDRTKNSGREFVKSAWQKENFALEGWQAKAGMISDRLAPENLEPPRPKGIGCLTYFVVLAVIIGIGRLLVWMFNFPPTPIAVLTMAFTLIAPFVIFAQMLGRSTKRSEWKQNIAFRKILFESFDEGCIQEVKRASRSIPVGLTPEDLSQDQILRLFSPPPVPDCTPREAEFLVADWMQFMGAENVKVTRASQDGGVDVTANGYVVQVKHYSNPVGPGPIREIAGVAHYLDQQPVFFSRSGYTAAAIAFGEHASVLMFTYNSDFGTATPVTALTRRSVDLSLGRPEL